MVTMAQGHDDCFVFNDQRMAWNFLARITMERQIEKGTPGIGSPLSGTDCLMFPPKNISTTTTGAIDTRVTLYAYQREPRYEHHREVT